MYKDISILSLKIPTCSQNKSGEAAWTVRADVGLPAVSEELVGVREVRSMVQLTLCILAEPYSK